METMSMMRSKSQTGFYTVKPFEIPTQTNDTGKSWKSNHMYITSYDKMSEKNVIIFLIKSEKCFKKFNRTVTPNKIKSFNGNIPKKSSSF